MNHALPLVLSKIIAKLNYFWLRIDHTRDNHNLESWLLQPQLRMPVQHNPRSGRHPPYKYSTAAVRSNSSRWTRYSLTLLRSMHVSPRILRIRQQPFEM